jgi:hypothetical protein
MYAIEWLIFYHLKDNGNKNCYCLIWNTGGFSFFLKEVWKISSEVQAAPLSELRQELGVRVKDFHTK